MNLVLANVVRAELPYKRLYMGKENFLYKKDDILTVDIVDIGNDGEGIGKIDGYTRFIKDGNR